MTVYPDFPLTREHTTCPICHRPKDKGLVTCWPCYRMHDLKFGMPSRILAAVHRTEDDLARLTPSE